MTTFPTLTPSTRTYSPGAFPHTAHRVYDGSEARVRHSNTVLGARLRLFFPALTTAELLTVIAHYNGQRGRFLPFAIPVELLSGTATPAEFTPAGHQWRYAAKPTTEDISVNGTTPSNLHNLTVELETVPPENTIVQGARLRVRATLQAGSAQLGVFFDVIGSLSAGSATGGQSLLLNTSASLFAGLASNGVEVSDPFAVVASLSAGAGSAGDSDFASVSLLLSMEGANNSTAFTDLSSNAFAISVFGDAKVVTTDSDFPNGALDLDGSGDYLTTPANAAFTFGTGDFTVECYCKPDVVSGNDGLFSVGNTMELALFSSSWYTSVTGASGFPGTATAATRQHVALCRAGSSLRLFIGGTQLGSTITSTGNVSADILSIGLYVSSSFTFDGRMSWLRVTKGVARYTATFTPPSTPFPTS